MSGLANKDRTQQLAALRDGMKDAMLGMRKVRTQMMVAMHADDEDGVSRLDIDQMTALVQRMSELKDTMRSLLETRRALMVG